MKVNYIIVSNTYIEDCDMETEPDIVPNIYTNRDEAISMARKVFHNNVKEIRHRTNEERITLDDYSFIRKPSGKSLTWETSVAGFAKDGGLFFNTDTRILAFPVV